MDHQLDLLEETDWDILIVFDACRWDYWNEMYGVGSPVRSPDSCTRDWIRTIRDELDWSDVVGVTGNPVVVSHGSFLKECYDVGADHHGKVNGIPTVPPDPITSRVKAESVMRSERIYAHFVQPHGPYPHSEPPLPIHRARPEHRNVEISVDGVPDEFVRNNFLNFLRESDEIEWETVRDGYRKNLQWAYDSVIDFAKSTTSSVVITSDHGEYLGEEDKYGHDCEYDSDIVRVVPWYEV